MDETGRQRCVGYYLGACRYAENESIRKVITEIGILSWLDFLYEIKPTEDQLENVQYLFEEWVKINS